MVSPEVQAERDRCADACERMAKIFDESAAKLRVDGTYQTTVISFLWPLYRREPAVHPRWENAARTKESAADCFRTVKRAIVEGWLWAPTG